MAKNFKNRVREQFGRAAEGYVRDLGFAGGDDLDAAREIALPTGDDLMLDIACGGGHTALYFAPYVRSVVASDLTMQMLKRAQEYISEEGGVENITFREADAEDLPFPAGAFTLLTCRIAPHHFTDIPRAMAEFHRVLRRHVGRMVIIDTLLPEDPEIAEFTQTMETMRDPTHIRSYTEEQWVEMVTAANFTVQKTAVFPKKHEFGSWARRAGLDAAGISKLNQFFIDASEKVHDFLKIETFAGEVESYTDQKLLVFATRDDKAKT